MKTMALSAPILPGKTDDGLRFAKQISGARRKDMTESRNALGQTRETTWVQHTPMGDMLLVFLEGKDSQRANEMFAASKTPFDVWFKDEAKGFTGIDWNQAMPEGAVELVVDAGQAMRNQESLAIAFPILPGKTEAWKSFAREAFVTRRKDFDDHDKRYNYTREQWYLQHTPMGDFAVVYLEGKDIVGGFKTWATSNQPFDTWQKNQLSVLHGVDFSKPLPPFPELAFDWQA